MNFFFPKKVFPKEAEDELDKCIICLSPKFSKKTIILEGCKHEFHFDCIASWFQKNNFNCPYCRSEQINAVILVNNVKKLEARNSLRYKLLYFKRYLCNDNVNFLGLRNIRY